MKLICIFHQNQTLGQKSGVFQGISSFTLHIIAMLLMLCDHFWATTAAKNLAVQPSSATIIDITKILKSQQEDQPLQYFLF